MKYLVVGDAASMHIYNFVKTVLLPRGYEVHLLTLSTERVKEKYRSFYIEQGVYIHSVAEKNYKNLGKTDKLHRILNLLRKFLLWCELPKVDICHIHSVYKTSIVMALCNRHKYKNIILSYWGGDIEDRSENLVRIREKCFKKAKVITVTVKQTFEDFKEIYGNAYDDKLTVSRFATDGINCINEISNTITREECRESYGIPSDKICITAGYSAYREQHQDRIIEELGKLPSELREKLFVIVPMQYGRMSDTEYLNAVEKAKNEADFDCVILKEFVPFEMSARLAVATDIYLHLRDTDAFSNALKEHIYAGSVVIKGDWLRYIELEEMNAPVISIPDFESLAKTIEICITNLKISKKIQTFEPIYELYSSDSVVSQWGAVIDRALKEN